MEVLNILSNNSTIFMFLIFILMINFCCIIYLIFKEKKIDTKEIDQMIEEMKISEPELKKEDNDNIEEVQDKKLEENKREVEEMLIKMQKDLEASPEEVVTNFENEQEEKSIISYQELLDSVKKQKEIKVTPVKIEEPTEEEKIEIKEPTEEEKIEIKEPEESLKFRGTEFISPIFGRQENNIKYPTVPKTNSTIINDFMYEEDKEIFNTKRLDEEIRKNDDFLKALKEFRKNLD